MQEVDHAESIRGQNLLRGAAAASSSAHANFVCSSASNSSYETNPCGLLRVLRSNASVARAELATCRVSCCTNSAPSKSRVVASSFNISSVTMGCWTMSDWASAMESSKKPKRRSPTFDSSLYCAWIFCDDLWQSRWAPNQLRISSFSILSKMRYQ